MNDMEESDKQVEVTVVMPCLNEADTLEVCINKAKQGLSDAGVIGEIIVADNGSTDDSIEIATKAGVRIVHTRKFLHN